MNPLTIRISAIETIYFLIDNCFPETSLEVEKKMEREIEDWYNFQVKMMELIYSPDDCGYYWQRFSDWKTSQVFETRYLANEARKKGSLKWN